MAQLLETLRNAVTTPVYGRRLGIQPDETLVFKAHKNAIEDLTTVASTLTAYGWAVVTATGSTQGPVQHTLPAPIPGVEKIILMNTTSTGSHQFLSTEAGATIRTASDGTTAGVVNLRGGAGVTLRGITTAMWMALPHYTSTGAPNVTFSTSTA